MKKTDRRRTRKIDDAKLKRLWASRMSEAALARAMGHHPGTLRRRAIKLGLPSSRRELWEASP